MTFPLTGIVVAWFSVNKNDNNRYLLPCHSIDFNFYFTTTISIHKCEWKYDKDDDHYYFDDNDSNDNNYYNNFELIMIMIIIVLV